MARKKNYDNDKKAEPGTLDEYRSLPDGDAEQILEAEVPWYPVITENPLAVAAVPVESENANAPVKKTRRPLVSREVNKAEAALMRFDDRVAAANETAKRFALKVEQERQEYIAALPRQARDALVLMGIIIVV